MSLFNIENLYEEYDYTDIYYEINNLLEFYYNELEEYETILEEYNYRGYLLEDEESSNLYKKLLQDRNNIAQRIHQLQDIAQTLEHDRVSQDDVMRQIAELKQEKQKIEMEKANYENGMKQKKSKKETNIPKQDEQKSQSTPNDPKPTETNIPKQDEQKSQPTPKGNSGGGGTSKKKSSPSTSSTPDSQPSWLSRNKYKAGAGALVGAAAGYGIYKKRHAIKNKLSNLWNRIRGRKQY